MNHGGTVEEQNRDENLAVVKFKAAIYAGS